MNEKLTTKKRGRAVLRKCVGEECGGVCTVDGCEAVADAVERLFEYEKVGLTPGGVERLYERYAETRRLCGYFERDITEMEEELDRLEEELHDIMISLEQLRRDTEGNDGTAS